MRLYSTNLGNVKLTTCKADIVEHMVDLIVNVIEFDRLTSGHSYLHTDGVSGAIKRYGIYIIPYLNAFRFRERSSYIANRLHIMPIIVKLL